MTTPEQPNGALAGSRILLVEDDDELRAEIRQFLEDRGMHVHAAADIAGARLFFRGRAFDLILMDLWLKQESGFDFLREVRRKSATPCLIMTAQDNIASNLINTFTGADDYVLKPLNPRELVARLSSLLGGKPDRPAHRAVKGFLHDRSGAVSIMAAISMFMLVAIAGLVIDGGSLYFARRNLQATTDAAALAAVQNPAQASAIAASVFSSNGYASPVLAVATGTYTADESLTVQSRFVVSASGINAVRVHAIWQQPTYFGFFFGLGRNMPLGTQAVAARVPTASFGAGTAVARLNGGLLNSVLSQLFGSSVSLSLIDYQALVTTNIQALPFLNQLATDISVGGSYQQLATSSVTIGQLLNAMIETVGASGEGNVTGTTLALKSLATQLSTNAAMPLSSILDITPLQGRTIGGVITAADPSLELNVMSILSASARTISGGHLINVGTALTIPVTNSVISTQLAVGSQMAQIAMASPGSTVNTAQIRLAITATLANINLGVATASISLPIFLEAASGQATLLSMACTTDGDRARISASAGLTKIQFGSVSPAALQNFSVPVVPVPQPVVGVTLLTIPVQVNISGGVSVAQSGPTTLDFTQSDIDAGTVKSVPGSAQTPFSLLSSNFTLTPNIANNPLLNGLLGSLFSALNPLVASLIAPLDAPVDQLLATLGLALGVVDVRVFDVSCRTPTLVG
jgi:uncharacterized membrane protein/ActR/RegA family two-component response regulator